MKASSLYLALGVAQLATCAPAVVRVGDISDAIRSSSLHQHTGPGQGPDQGGAPVVVVVVEPPPPHRLILTRPLHDALLPPLSKHRTPPPPPGAGVGGSPYPSIDGNVVTPPQLGMPCHGAGSSHERNDMLVVFLAVAFMAMVVVMETWGSISRRRRQGAIRLEETTKQQQQPPPISIQAMSDNQSGIGDEKRCT